MSGAALEAALAYADRGWPVFPLHPGEKTPLIANRDGGKGVHDATLESDQIGRWWSACPHANIGVAAGGGFWVLDVDYGGWKAVEPDGADAIHALQQRFTRLPPTVTSRTGGGGWQYLFTADSAVKNGIRALPGIDTQSAGGYIVAPPSLHPSGASYHWRRGYGPDEIEIATAPDWLLRIVEPVELPTPPSSAPVAVGHLDRYAQAALERAAAAVQRAAIGEQCDVLDRQAYGLGRLVAGGVVPAASAHAVLMSAGRSMANDPRRRRWSPAEIEHRIGRAFAQAAHRPRAPEARHG